MNSNCWCPIALRAASTMAVVGLGLAIAPAAHANSFHLMGIVMLLMMIAFAVGVIVLGLVAWVALGWDRPRENRWAACSLILGLGSPLVYLFGPFAILTGIVAYHMGGSKRMAVGGIVLGTVGILVGVYTLLEYLRG